MGGCLSSKVDTPDTEPAAASPVTTAPSQPAGSMSGASGASATGAAAPAATGAVGGAVGAAAPKKLDPKDFMFSNEKNKTLVKNPGSINGQMFIIEDCDDCDLYVCDWTATVTVDVCKGCRIFIGPCESSVFIRNCTDCQIIVATQQFRTRECNNCDVLLYSKTDPVLEESKAMRLGCFRFNYFSLRAQFESAKLSFFDNKWSQVYDFTPPAAGATPNWTYLPPETKSTDLMKPLSEVSTFVTAEEAAQLKDDDLVPLTWGGRPRPPHKGCFALAYPGQEDAVKDFLAALRTKNPEVILMQTCVISMDKGRVETILAKQQGGDMAQYVAKLTKGPCAGMELVGPDALAAVAAAAEATMPGNLYVSSSQEAADHEIRVFFEQWKEHAGMAVR